jgi:hypothetical protein
MIRTAPRTGAVRIFAAAPTTWWIFSMLSFRALILCVSLFVSAGLAHADALPSWNAGPSKTAIVEFVERVTDPGGPDYVAPAKRIATFDNDGTLWSEQPLYFQLIYALARVQAMAPDHPEWVEGSPALKAAIEGDAEGALSFGKKGLLEVVMASHSGMTTAEFETVVSTWLATARHPTTGRRYTEMVFQPMLDAPLRKRSTAFRRNR